MDIWGVPGVEAEAEILSAIVTCFKNLGLSKDDVGIRVRAVPLVNSHQLMMY